MFDEIVRMVFAVMVLVAADMVFEANFPVVREISIYTEKLKRGKELLLLQISDFHGSSSGNIAATILREVEKIKPDAILLTGDLVDRHTENLEGIYGFIGKLSGLCSEIFFVSGNHEWSNEGRNELLATLKTLGVKLLNNKGSAVALAGTDINICGVDDPYRRKDDIEKAMKVIDPEKYTILLAHSPKIRKRLESHVPDLILCGHTHGGQVRFPFIGALFEPGEGLFPEYDKGIFYLKNGSLLYIDSGAGTSKLAIRFLNRSQISKIRIIGSR